MRTIRRSVMFYDAVIAMMISPPIRLTPSPFTRYAARVSRNMPRLRKRLFERGAKRVMQKKKMSEDARCDGAQKTHQAPTRRVRRAACRDTI